MDFYFHNILRILSLKEQIKPKYITYECHGLMNPHSFIKIDKDKIK